VESQCRDGRAPSFRRPPAGRRINVRCAPGVRYIPSRQVTRSTVGTERARLVRSDRPLAAAGALCQPVASASREPDRQPEARPAALGARKIRELLVRRLNGDVCRREHHSCRARPPRSGPSHEQTSPSRHWNAALTGRGTHDLWCADDKGEFRPQGCHKQLSRIADGFEAYRKRDGESPSLERAHFQSLQDRLRHPV
jgi:hypothetical protein